MIHLLDQLEILLIVLLLIIKNNNTLYQLLEYIEFIMNIMLILLVIMFILEYIKTELSIEQKKRQIKQHHKHEAKI